jgi:hypothetical protein
MKFLFTRAAVCRALSAVLTVAALFAVSRPAQAQTGYSLSIIAQTGDVINGVTLTGFSDLTNPTLGNDGGISFVANSSAGRGIFSALGANKSVVAVAGSVVGGTTITGIESRFSPARAANGTTVFTARYNDPNNLEVAVFSQNGLLARSLQNIEGYLPQQINPDFFAVNNNGEAAFASVSFFDPNRTSGSGGLFTPTRFLGRTDEPSQISGVSEVTTASARGGLRFNNNGTVVLIADFVDTNGIATTGLLTQSGVLAREGDRFTGVTGGLARVAEIYTNAPFGFNDNGQYAYRGRIEDSRIGSYNAVVTSSGIVAQPGTILSGLQILSFSDSSTFIAGPSLNNSGQVAFLANIFGGRGIFTQNELVARSGAAVGDTTISQLFGTSSPSLNDAGAVAFLADFANGQRGIVLATPIVATAPEAGTLFFVLAGGATMGTFAVRRRLSNRTTQHIRVK